jgi:hypothetical protein
MKHLLSLAFLLLLPSTLACSVPDGATAKAVLQNQETMATRTIDLGMIETLPDCNFLARTVLDHDGLAIRGSTNLRWRPFAAAARSYGTPDPVAAVGHDNGTLLVAVSQDSHALIQTVSADSSRTTVLDLGEMRLTSVMDIHGDRVLVQDGKSIAVWDISKQGRIASMRAGDDGLPASARAISLGNQYVAFATDDGLASWKLDGGDVKKTALKDLNGIAAGDSAIYATSGFEGTLHVWSPGSTPKTRAIDPSWKLVDAYGNQAAFLTFGPASNTGSYSPPPAEVEGRVHESPAGSLLVLAALAIAVAGCRR